MKQIFIFLTLTILFNCSGQKSNDIKIIDERISEQEFRKKEIELKSKTSRIFYEDELYLVSKECYGEWGGLIIFENKKSKKKFSSISTCPISVIKKDDKYIITNTLAHGSGFSDILEIENPEMMEKYSKKFNKNSSQRGTRKIIDTIGVLTLATFINNGEFNFITTDFKKTYISKIENSKFVNILELSQNGIWSYDPELIDFNNHKYLFLINNQNKGYFDIFKNEIKIYYVK